MYVTVMSLSAYMALAFVFGFIQINWWWWWWWWWWNAYRSLKSRKKSLKIPIFGLRSFKVIGVGTPGKVVSSACYDKQQVCVYLQPFSR